MTDTYKTTEAQARILLAAKARHERIVAECQQQMKQADADLNALFQVALAGHGVTTGNVEGIEERDGSWVIVVSKPDIAPEQPELTDAA